jgi:hypothetical protein
MVESDLVIFAQHLLLLLFGHRHALAVDEKPAKSNLELAVPFELMAISSGGVSPRVSTLKRLNMIPGAFFGPPNSSTETETETRSKGR